mgnify:FL=1|tara:strand:+ start:808 stop:1698 length:891 start_codon:yes stop_codon:yes gene_type:complete
MYVAVETESDSALSAKLVRISACAHDINSELGRNLLHAYVACLTFVELMTAAKLSLEDSKDISGAIRNRLVRLGREGKALREIDSLGTELMQGTHPNQRARRRVEALLSHIYPFLMPPTRQAVLERWRGRGTRGAGRRWLKAISNDELLFSLDLVFQYWRESRDENAAKVLVNSADPNRLTELLPELVAHCESGWIVSRGALRARSILNETWMSIRTKFPATYAYLCARMDRNLTEQEALDIIGETDAGVFGDRGLAIWAIGQLNMSSVLDRVWENRERIYISDMEQLGIVIDRKR